MRRVERFFRFEIEARTAQAITPALIDLRRSRRVDVYFGRGQTGHRFGNRAKISRLLPHSRRFEQRYHRDIAPELVANAVGKLNEQQRGAASFEEMVLSPNLLVFQELAPKPQEILFELSGRRVRLESRDR